MFEDGKDPPMDHGRKGRGEVEESQASQDFLQSIAVVLHGAHREDAAGAV